MQRQPTVPTMPSRRAPRRAATSRYTLTLRRRLPNEALLIEDLEARASGRRAQRIRALLTLGLDRDPPPNALGHGGDPQVETGTLRITVLIHEVDPEDAVLRAALAMVGPQNRQEWLRDRLAAGLCGVDVPLDVGQAYRVKTPPQRSCPPDTRSLGRPTTPEPPLAGLAEVWTDDVDEIPPSVTVEHDIGPNQSPDVIDKDDADGVAVGEEAGSKLSDLAGLFA